MQREGDLPFHRHLTDRRSSCPLEPWIRHAVGARLRGHAWLVGVQENAELCSVKVLVVHDARGLLNAIGVIEHDAEITDAPDARLRAHRRLAGLDARIAE